MTQTRHKLIALSVLAIALLSACVPEVDDAFTRVDAPRVLAIRAEPAEVRPLDRESLTLSALYADENGTLHEASLDWAFCLERKALAELGPVSPLCLQRESDALIPLGEGLSADGEIPSDACRLFGPERPTPKAGEPAGRPVDADPTGGYYQPVRVRDTERDEYVLFEARITCGLPSATLQQSAELTRRYTPNENPELHALLALRDGDDDEPLPIAGEDEPLIVEPGETLTLRASWDECDAITAECEGDEEECGPAPTCTGSEGYLYFDPEALSLSARREAMRVSWFSSDGTFRDPRTGRTEAGADRNHSDNVWTAPDAPGDVTLWVVLRDDRGGTGWQSYALRVVP